ncbi:MAG: hypothetical protein AB7F88_05530 [Pyrinomonadaceae bacterium]
MSRNLNRKSLCLFILVVSSSSVLLIAGWLIGLMFGGINGHFGAGIGGGVGALVGGEIGHRKGLFEADWDRLVSVGPWCGYLLGFVSASLVGTQGWIFAVFAVLGAGLGGLFAKYLLRFFEYDPPLSIK